MRHRNLASERVRIGMNQTELADALGTSIKNITKYENDPDAMPGDFLLSAASFFGCSTDYLLDATDDRRQLAAMSE